MNQDLFAKFTQKSGLTDDLIPQFLNLIELPDSKFEAIYDEIMSGLKHTLTSKAFQDELLLNLQTTNIYDLDAEKKEIEEFIKEMNEDNTLSDKKKEFLTCLINLTTKKVIELYEVPRERINVKIQKLNPDAIIPTYAHKTDAGMDIYAVEDTILLPNETKIIKTGFKIAIPVGYEIQIRPRSGMSLKTNLRVANAPGTIDADYRGEVGVVMTNISNDCTETISKGTKVAQMVIAPTPMIEWEECEIDDNTSRGTNGYGSTDVSK